jgi:uncharacterized protein YjbI with pentapeptide repeats
VAKPEHLELLRQGVDVWNASRREERSTWSDLRWPDLNQANLSGARLSHANLQEAGIVAADLSGADLSYADLRHASLVNANLSGANLFGANLNVAHLVNANLTGANLYTANLDSADLEGANLDSATLYRANFFGANLNGANLSGANLVQANLHKAILTAVNLSGAGLTEAALTQANLSDANLSGAEINAADLSGASLIRANLHGANLSEARLVETDVADAVLTNCRVYGISAWNVKLNERTKQQGLIITPDGEAPVTVDDLGVAQFVYLLLRNENIRRVIDTVGKAGVLLLGRFTEGRIVVLERLRDELRRLGYLPIVFNFDKPETKDFTETVRLLAGLAKFVIADITNPKSAPLELQATVPEIMVPFRPIIEEGEKPFAMLQDLWIKHREWMFEPIHYSSVDALIAALDEKIIRPAEARFVELQKRKADTMGGEHV